jgi:hypothetical protein
MISFSLHPWVCHNLFWDPLWWFLSAYTPESAIIFSETPLMISFSLHPWVCRHFFWDPPWWFLSAYYTPESFLRPHLWFLSAYTPWVCHNLFCDPPDDFFQPTPRESAISFLRPCWWYLSVWTSEYAIIFSETLLLISFSLHPHVYHRLFWYPPNNFLQPTPLCLPVSLPITSGIATFMSISAT